MADQDSALADMQAALGPAPSAAPDGGPDDRAVADMQDAISGHQAESQPIADVPPPPKPRVRPAGAPGPPTRLRGQGPAPAQQPGKPPAPEDLSARGVVSGIIANAPSDFADQLGQFVGAVDPRNWPAEFEGAKQLATGVASKTGLLIPNTPQQKAQDEAALDAVVGMYKHDYGSPQAALSTLKNHPVKVAADLGALLTIPAGGEGLAERVPGTVGKVLTTAAKASRVGAEALNPVSLTARAAGTVLPGVARAARLSRYAGDAGEGGIMADETGQRALRAVGRRKGSSQPAYNEAVLRAATGEEKAPLASSIVTGDEPSTDVAPAVEKNTAAWRQRVGAAAADLGGNKGEAPHPSAVGDALEDAQVGASNGVVDAYQNFQGNTGKFAGAFAATAPGVLNQGMLDAGLPSLAEMAGSAKPGGLGQLGAATPAQGLPAYEQTTKAASWLTKHLNDLAGADNLTPQNLMHARQQITGHFFPKAVDGVDQKGLGTLLAAFDKHVADAAEAGMYAGGDGAKVARDMRGAMDASKAYRSTFEDSPIGPAVRQITASQVKGPDGRIVSRAAPGATTQAQDTLTKAIINQKNLTSGPKAELTYNALHGALGGEGSAGAEALNNHIRHTVTQTTSTGELAAKPDQIHNFLRGPLARSAFPDVNDHSQLRRLAEGQRLLTAQSSKAAVAHGFLRTIAGRAPRYAAAAALGHMTFHNPFLGYLAEQMLVEPYFAGRGLRAAMRGAPKKLPFGPMRGAGALARYAAEHPGRTAASTRLYGALPAPGTMMAERPAGPEPGAAISGASGWAPPNKPVFDKIRDVAKRNGASDDEVTTLQHLAHMEMANDDPSISSPSGRYKGAFQYPGGGDIEADTAHALKDLRLHENKLADMGIEPSAANLYIVHQQGAAGGPALLSAPPGAGAVDTLAKVYGSRDLARQAIAHNIGLPYGTPEGEARANAAAERMTAADFVQHWQDKWRTSRAAGGQVVDMTARLLKRANQAQKAAQSSTRPLLGLSDDTVAAALRVAQRGI